MSRRHCSLNTNNFEASVDFYTKLCGLLPVRLENGYAKFSSNDPSVNLTLNYVSNPINHNAINHMGIEVDDSQAVYAAQKRLERLGLATKLEKDIDCCYSFQHKIWVSDPNGYNWEFFFVRDQEIIGNRDSVSEDCLSTECCE